MKKQIDFTDRAIEIVGFVQKEEGQRTFTAALHSIIASYYNKTYFSKYGKGVGGQQMDPAKPELTVEQWIEQEGGVIKDGTSHWKLGAMRLTVPITDITTMSKTLKDRGYYDLRGTL